MTDGTALETGKQKIKVAMALAHDYDEATAEVADEQDALAAEAPSWAICAKDFRVVCEFSFDEAAEMRRQLKDRIARVNTLCEKGVTLAHQAHKAACAVRAFLRDPYIAAEKILGEEMDRHEDEQRRKQEDEHRRLEADARKREADRRKAAAEDLRAQGQTEAAKELIEAPTPPPLVIPQPKTAVESEGVSYRTTWSARVVDKPKFFAFLGQNPALQHLGDGNTKELNRMATSQKQAMNIPGVEAVVRRSSNVRR